VPHDFIQEKLAAMLRDYGRTEAGPRPIVLIAIEQLTMRCECERHPPDRSQRRRKAPAGAGLGLALALLSAGALDAQAQMTTCSTFMGKYHASTNCYTTPTRKRPSTYLSPEGVLHYWSRPMRTYCFRNQYNLERCIDRLDTEKLMCGDIDGDLYCRPFP